MTGYAWIDFLLNVYCNMYETIHGVELTEEDKECLVIGFLQEGISSGIKTVCERGEFPVLPILSVE